MRITLNTNKTSPLIIDNQEMPLSALDDKILGIINEKQIDLKEYTLSNKYLRAIIKRDGFEYHVLEKPSGVTNIHCVGSNARKKTLKFNMPYTIMIVKLYYINGVYIKKGDRVFHSDEPVKKDLSNKLWSWGLSNVYPTGNICWGNETLPNIDRHNSFQYIDEFFMGIKNNDLLQNKNIDWANMSTDIVYELNLKNLKRKNEKLIDEIYSNNF